MSEIRQPLLVAVLALVLAACAPQTKTAAPVEAETVATPTPTPAALSPRLPLVEPTPVEQSPQVSVPARPLPSIVDEANPDWGKRFQSLYAHYEKSFKVPEIGGQVEVTMQNGQSRQGKLESLSASELVLNVGMGTMTLPSESLADTSKVQFFSRDFAQLNAMNQLREERAKWTEQQRLASRPTPTPQGYRDISKASGGQSPKGDPPRNEPPNGRVWQVEQYLRKSVAVPHSLRFLDWGRVHPHGDGFTVRCKYTVESADGFGKNTEEMIFFMRADGTVYNKAAFKGDRT